MEDVIDEFNTFIIIKYNIFYYYINVLSKIFEI